MTDRIQGVGFQMFILFFLSVLGKAFYKIF